MDYISYESPFSGRYASREMQYLFSDDKKFKTWRKIWIALAEAEKELGLNITDEQIEDLKKYAEDINFEVAKERERIVKHDVMSHIYAYGEQAKCAKPIIHLGATSCEVGDNADIIIMSEAMELIRAKIINIIDKLSKFAEKYKDMPTLGFTHYQPAQLTTVGKRACLWIEDLWTDLKELENQKSNMMLRGLKGTTGTQASFLNLFEGNHEKVKEMERAFIKRLGFEKAFPVTGQTYPRKLDSQVIQVLCNIAQSAYKFSNDLRLLQNLKEIEEPFEKEQVGSSAMPYKRNPMRSERISALSRYVICSGLNPVITASTQWFERTLDDSANRRICIAESFLATDTILNLYLNISENMVVYPKVIEKRIMSELPFMASESILMESVKRGEDRQEIHERIRVHSMEAGKKVKEMGMDNDLLERIIADEKIPLDKEEIDELLSPKNFIGRSKEQVEEFLNEFIKPILDENKEILGMTWEMEV